jgi:hypothetical protein
MVTYASGARRICHFEFENLNFDFLSLPAHREALSNASSGWRLRCTMSSLLHHLSVTQFEKN